MPLAGAASPDAAFPPRKLKLSSVIDPALEADIPPLEHQAVSKMYAGYKLKFGDRPSPDCEPTTDQLSGISQLLKSNSLLYCDFSLFGPHGC